MNDPTGSASSTQTIKPIKQCHIVLVPIEKLLPHEEVVDTHIHELKNSLSRLGYFFRPILISKGSDKVILDGHHRVSALIEMGAKQVPCVEISYMDNDEIKLGTWHPIYERKISFRKIKKIIRGNSIQYNELSELDLKFLDKKDVAFVLYNLKKSFVLRGSQKFVFNSLISNLDSKAFQYISEVQEAIHRVKQKSASFCLLRSRVTKKDVMDHAMNGDLFAPKTTRHALKFRYQDTKVPLDALF